MAIKFEELRKYIAHNVRLSICFEDGYYHDLSDDVRYSGTEICRLFHLWLSEWLDVEFFQRCLCGPAGNRKENAGAGKMIQ